MDSELCCASRRCWQLSVQRVSSLARPSNRIRCRPCCVSPAGLEHEPHRRSQQGLQERLGAAALHKAGQPQTLVSVYLPRPSCGPFMQDISDTSDLTRPSGLLQGTILEGPSCQLEPRARSQSATSCMAFLSPPPLRSRSRSVGALCQIVSQ